MDFERLMFLRSNMAYVMGELRSCSAKSRFTTYNIAVKIGSEMNRSKICNHKVVPYFCPFCGKWHIGKNCDKKIHNYPIRLDKKVMKGAKLK
jgi:hypothetical protein